MAIQWANNQIVCLDADIASLPTNVPENTKAWAYNTGKQLRLSTGLWLVENSKGGYDYIIHKIGSTYYISDDYGQVMNANANPATIIQYGLDNGNRKRIWISAASYAFLAGFPGLNFTQDECVVDCSPGAAFGAPSGHTGYIWKFQTGNFMCELRNGMLWEQAGQKNWQGVIFEGGDSGCFRNRLIDTYMVGPHTGVLLRTTGANNWIHGNKIASVYVLAPIIGFDFAQAGGSIGINRNTFIENVVQSTATTTNGFRNISGTSNVFIDCKPWDITGANSTANIAASGTNTIIIGGIMTFANFTDVGTNNSYDDQWRTKLKDAVEVTRLRPVLNGSAAAIDFGQDNVAQASFNLAYWPNADAGTVTNSWWNRSATERMYIQRNSTSYIVDIVRQSAGGALKPFIIRTLDIPNASALAEYYRVDTANARNKFSQNIEIADKDVLLGTTTGSKIGTTDLQKLGLWGVAPVTQRSLVASPANNVDSLKTAVDALRQLCIDVGLMKAT